MSKGDAAGNEVLIRARKDGDISETAGALVSVHGADGYPVEGVDQPEAWLTPEGLIQGWVAELSDNIVGHVCITWARDEAAVALFLEQSSRSKSEVAVMARLFVVPEARGRSVGARLVQEATDYARRQGLALVGDVMMKDVAAIRLYERLGCQILGTTKHSYGVSKEIPALCFAAPTD